jgi:hypothetical protein
MSITARDIQAEHHAALRSLTPPQRRALERIACSRRQSSFNHRWPSENLKAIFASEAQARSAS